ncbi:MAG: type II toxin-antitoxin system PrlF family antitoxin [bacterium]
MPSSTVTSKGQITVPKAVRERLALQPGDRLSFIIHDDGTVTVEAETVEVTSLRGVLKAGGKHVTVDQMDDAITLGATRA